MNEKLTLRYAGIHPQEDRDARSAVKVAGQEKKLWQMIRIRVPLGRLTAEQYLALDEIADRVTYNRSLRVTAGQSIQLHGLHESDTKPVIEEIAGIGLAPGCHSGGFEFAVALSPVPAVTESYRALRRLAAEVTQELYPRPGVPVLPHPDHAPRKFAVGLSIPEDNTANIFANDVSLLLVKAADGERRVNVYAGGSMSMPSRGGETYARLATVLGSVQPGQAVATIKAIAAVFKKFGQLATRRHTRLKYVVDELGADGFRGAVETELGFTLSPAVATPELSVPSWFGSQAQGDGRVFYGLGLPHGRIQDVGLRRYKTAVRMIVETFRPTVILSPDQNIVLADLTSEQVFALEKILAAYHVPYGDRLTRVRFEAMACAGLPTCPLALAESERVAGPILDELEAELGRIGKKEFPFSFRISGCAIGCIRPNMVDLGAIGRRPGHYDLYVGGSEAVGQFGHLYAEAVPLAEIVSTIRPLLEFWGARGRAGESFSEFYGRWFGDGYKPARLSPNEATPVRACVEQRISAAETEPTAS